MDSILARSVPRRDRDGVALPGPEPGNGDGNPPTEGPSGGTDVASESVSQPQ